MTSRGGLSRKPRLATEYSGWKVAEGWEIPRVDAAKIGAEEFFEKYVQPRKPCVLVGHLQDADWLVTSKWTLPYLRKTAGNAPVVVERRADLPAKGLESEVASNCGANPDASGGFRAKGAAAGKTSASSAGRNGQPRAGRAPASAPASARPAGDIKSLSVQPFGHGSHIPMTFGEFIETIEAGSPDYYLSAQELAEAPRPAELGGPGATSAGAGGPCSSAGPGGAGVSPPPPGSGRDRKGGKRTRDGQVDGEGPSPRTDGHDLFVSPEFPVMSPLPTPMHMLCRDFPLRPSLLPTLVPQQVNLWMGHAQDGASSGLHHDFHDNLYVLVSGKKRFTLFSPADAYRMYTSGNITHVFPNGVINYDTPTRADGVPLAELEKPSGRPKKHVAGSTRRGLASESDSDSDSDSDPTHEAFRGSDAEDSDADDVHDSDLEEEDAIAAAMWAAHDDSEDDDEDDEDSGDGDGDGDGDSDGSDGDEDAVNALDAFFAAHGKTGKEGGRAKAKTADTSRDEGDDDGDDDDDDGGEEGAGADDGASSDGGSDSSVSVVNGSDFDDDEDGPEGSGGKKNRMAASGAGGGSSSLDAELRALAKLAADARESLGSGAFEGSDHGSPESNDDHDEDDDDDDSDAEQDPRASTLPPSFSTVPVSMLHGPRERLLSRFPLLSKAKRVTCELSAGEMLWLPAGWFHEVTSFSPSKPSRLGRCHCALNYWFHPTDVRDSSMWKTPYLDPFWQRRWDAYKLEELPASSGNPAAVGPSRSASDKVGAGAGPATKKRRKQARNAPSAPAVPAERCSKDLDRQSEFGASEDKGKGKGKGKDNGRRPSTGGSRVSQSAGEALDGDDGGGSVRSKGTRLGRVPGKDVEQAWGGEEWHQGGDVDDAARQVALDNAKRGVAVDGKMYLDRGKQNAEEYNLAHVVRAGVDPYAYEGLADGDDDVPWTQPQVNKAKIWRRVMTFEKGKASLKHTGPEAFANLGPGLALYFVLLKQAAITLAIMTFFYIPYMHFAFTGNGVIDLDEAETAKVSLGNAGIRPVEFFNESILLFPESGGVPLQDPPKNETSFMGITFTHEQMAQFIAVETLLNLLVYAIFSFVFFKTMRLITRRSNETSVLTSAYSVFVRGLPIDATEGEVRRHFSDLFQLADPDWEFNGWFCGVCCRKKPRLPQDMEDSGDLPNDQDVIEQVDPVDPCRPVADVSNSQDESYLSQWVAEVSLVFKDSKAIRAHLEREDLRVNLRNARAIAKKYSVDTPLKSGPNARKKLAALKRVERYEKQMMLLRSKLGGTSSECIAAYVVFNNEESALRCIEDYKRSSGLLSRYLQPLPLRFRGQHSLIVERAAEPKEILWENLETRGAAKAIRQAISALALVLLLLLSFGLAYATFRNRGVLGDPDVIPRAAACEGHIPAALYGQYLTKLNPQIIRTNGGFPRCRNPDADLYFYFDLPDVEDHIHPESSLLEAEISPLPPNITVRKFELLNQLDELRLINNFIRNITNDTVPLPTDPCAGPCIDVDYKLPLSGQSACVPLACSEPGWNRLGHFCDEPVYDPNLVVDCFCQQELQKEIDNQGLILGSLAVRDGPNGDICTDYVSKFFWNRALPYLGAFILVVMSGVLQSAIVRLAKFERFSSMKAMRLSILIKVFLACWINSAWILVLVFVRLPGGAELHSLSGVMKDGVWGELQSDWYPVVGFYLTLLLLYSSVLPHLLPMAHWLLWKPLQRQCLTRSTPTQMGLNKLHEGPLFDVPVKYGVAVSQVVTILTFSSALPLMLPIGCGLFILKYWVDKLLFLRFYSKPDFLTHSMPSLVTKLLPWAMVPFLLFALWAHGSPSVIDVGFVDLSELGFASDKEDSDEKVQAIIDALESFDPFDLAPAMLRSNTILISLALIVVFVSLILGMTVGGPIAKLTRKFIELLTFGCFCKADPLNPDRRFVPPYTDIFVREMNPRDEYELLDDEMYDGWVLETDARSQQTLSKVWLADGSVQGVPHRKGDRKRTWEILRDESLHTYRIAHNAKYAGAISPAAPGLSLSATIAQEAARARWQAAQNQPLEVV